MTGAAAIIAPGPRITLATIAKWSAVVVLGVVGSHFFVHNALRYLNITEKTYQGYWPHRGWLMVHIAGGSLALLFGPLQFYGRLRRARPALHRWMGRFYLGGVVIGAFGAIYMGCVTKRRDFGISLIAMAFAWLSTAAMAYLAIRRRQFGAHREWMVRSYIVTYGFVTFRAIQNAGLLSSLGPRAPAMTAWFCWVIPLLCADFVLQWRRTVGPASTNLHATPS